MELEILHMIQGMRTDWLDGVMVFVTKLGDKGILWIALSIVLAILPKTRRCGLTMMVTMLLSHVVGNEILKPLIARARPFTADAGVTLLIPQLASYSFPSGHTMNGFTAAFTVCAYYKKPGIMALVMAGLIAFSRMYLFVHYPTDILGGIVLAFINTCVVQFAARKLIEWYGMRRKT